MISDFNSHSSLLKEADVVSTVVENKFTIVVLSDVDYNTIYHADDIVVKSNDEFTASPLSVFLEMTDLAGQDLLLHPACSDLFAFCMHTRQTALLL